MSHTVWLMAMIHEIILEWYQTVVVRIHSWTGELLRKFIRWQDWRIEKDIESKIFITMELSDSRQMLAFLELGFIVKDFGVTSMLLTDVGEMCWWQVWDVVDRFNIHQHNEKSRQHNDSATNIWNQSPS